MGATLSFSHEIVIRVVYNNSQAETVCGNKHPQRDYCYCCKSGNSYMLHTRKNYHRIQYVQWATIAKLVQNSSNLMGSELHTPELALLRILGRAFVLQLNYPLFRLN